MIENWVTKNIREQKELRQLFQDAASAVAAPKLVKVRWKDDLGSQGLLTKTLNDWYCLDISTNLEPEQQYETLLHELGHVLDASHEVKPTSYARTGKREAPSLAEITARPRLESTADSIAEKLDSYALAKAYDFMKFGETALHAKLRALASYKPAKAEQTQITERKIWRTTS
jgi:hypothetical protein